MLCFRILVWRCAVSEWGCSVHSWQPPQRRHFRRHGPQCSWQLSHFRHHAPQLRPGKQLPAWILWNIMLVPLIKVYFLPHLGNQFFPTVPIHFPKKFPLGCLYARTENVFNCRMREIRPNYTPSGIVFFTLKSTNFAVSKHATEIFLLDLSLHVW